MGGGDESGDEQTVIGSMQDVFFRSRDRWEGNRRRGAVWSASSIPGSGVPGLMGPIGGLERGEDAAAGAAAVVGEPGAQVPSVVVGWLGGPGACSWGAISSIVVSCSGFLASEKPPTSIADSIDTSSPAPDSDPDESFPVTTISSATLSSLCASRRDGGRDVFLRLAGLSRAYSEERSESSTSVVLVEPLFPAASNWAWMRE